MLSTITLWLVQSDITAWVIVCYFMLSLWILFLFSPDKIRPSILYICLISSVMCHRVQVILCYFMFSLFILFLFFPGKIRSSILQICLISSVTCHCVQVILCYFTLSLFMLFLFFRQDKYYYNTNMLY